MFNLNTTAADAAPKNFAIILGQSIDPATGARLLPTQRWTSERHELVMQPSSKAHEMLFETYYNYETVPYALVVFSSPDERTAFNEAINHIPAAQPEVTVLLDRSGDKSRPAIGATGGGLYFSPVRVPYDDLYVQIGTYTPVSVREWLDSHYDPSRPFESLRNFAASTPPVQPASTGVDLSSVTVDGRLIEGEIEGISTAEQIERVTYWRKQGVAVGFSGEKSLSFGKKNDPRSRGGPGEIDTVGRVKIVFKTYEATLEFAKILQKLREAGDVQLAAPRAAGLGFANRQTLSANQVLITSPEGSAMTVSAFVEAYRATGSLEGGWREGPNFRARGLFGAICQKLEDSLLVLVND